jgi:aldose 1-epimerase
VKIHEDYVELHHDGTRLTLDPRRGGAIRDFQWRERAIFRPTAAADGDDPFDMACFPMVPFVNRVAGGRFSFGEHAVQLARNWSADPHPLHGHGWRVPWSLVETSLSCARLQFDGGADEWPWRYRCEQSFELRQDALEVQLGIRNLSDAPMPAMLGLHPYFGDAAHARLQARLPRVWITDGAALPIDERPTPAEWAFDSARAIDTVPLDHCFSGWNGIATLSWSDHTVTMRAAGCSHLQIYASTDRDFFCVEPQTAMSGALGRGDGAATVVAPGGRFEMRVQFDVSAC